MPGKRIDPEARGGVGAIKRAALIGVTDQRTTSGPVDQILRAQGRRQDRTHDQRNAKKALDQRATSRHDTTEHAKDNIRSTRLFSRPPKRW
jgi:hypothetical protein